MAFGSGGIEEPPRLGSVSRNYWNGGGRVRTDRRIEIGESGSPIRSYPKQEIDRISQNRITAEGLRECHLDRDARIVPIVLRCRNPAGFPLELSPVPSESFGIRWSKYPIRCVPCSVPP